MTSSLTRADSVQNSRSLLLLETCILSFLFVMSGDVINGVHEFGHALAALFYVPPGSTVEVNVLVGYVRYHVPLDTMPQIIVFSAGPLVSFVLLNIIVIIQAFLKKRRILKVFLWAIACRSVMLSVGYFAGTFIFKGDSNYIARQVSTLTGASFTDIGMLFTILGVVLTGFYYFIILRGLYYDLQFLQSGYILQRDKKLELVLPVAFVAIAFATMGYGTIGWLGKFARALHLHASIDSVWIHVVIIGSVYVAMYIASHFALYRFAQSFHRLNTLALVLSLVLVVSFMIFLEIQIIR